ncbi:MAG: Undecaprenol kinase [Firmicutes bacterium ADurb.Bin456]|nr:MAG: Undecaprenol kinase [Firmicutes bacterium ADurb.Bin456]
MGLKKVLHSFQYAVDGLLYALKTQRNMRFHLTAALIVLGAALYFRIGSRDFVLLFFAITLVLMAEMFNTSIEKAVDLFVQEYHHLAKVAKNTAAGAVLVTALNALVVAYVIFYPRLESAGLNSYRGKESPLLITTVSILLVMLLTMAGKAWTSIDTGKKGRLLSGRTALAFAGGTSVTLLTGDFLIATIALAMALLVAHGRLGRESPKFAGIIAGALLGILVTIAVFKFAGW